MLLISKKAFDGSNAFKDSYFNDCAPSESNLTDFDRIDMSEICRKYVGNRSEISSTELM